MRRPATGYIVTVEGRMMLLSYYRDAPKGGVLAIGYPYLNEATVFSSKREVINAVKRTLRYAKAKGFNWPIVEDGYRTVKLFPPE